MGARLFQLPLILLLVGVFALAMLPPAVVALVQEDHRIARAFFYASLLGLVGAVMVALALGPAATRGDSDGKSLASLFLAYTLLPLFLALPFHEGFGTTSYLNAYFEMVSCLTTTGATLFDAPDRLADSLHLWRGMVGWLGGLLIWVCAAAVLAPLNLGGFEVTARAEPGQGSQRFDRFRRAGAARRLARSTGALAPIYVGLTGALWILLLISGARPLVAIMHAMATLATSGISPIGGVADSGSGLGGEAIIFLFLLFALSRLTFSSDTLTAARPRPLDDPEFRVGLLLVVSVPLVLFLRHWLGALEVDEEENLRQALGALWGGVFTVLSFLSTTGFESAAWDASRSWSGLGTPGLVLLGLSVLGGGVATTAGGVKLLRVYALYLQGRRELERLVHPSSVGGRGPTSRRIRREGAFIAWIFFMLFALSLTLIMVTLSALGQDFEAAMVLTIAALSTTGPLVQSAVEQPIALIDLGAAAKLVLCAAMVLGRLETLAIIALFNPALWRD